jgi:hypothetical protein
VWTEALQIGWRGSSGFQSWLAPPVSRAELADQDAREAVRQAGSTLVTSPRKLDESQLEYFACGLAHKPLRLYGTGSTPVAKRSIQLAERSAR